MGILIGAWSRRKIVKLYKSWCGRCEARHIFPEGKNNCLTKLHDSYDPHMKYVEIIASGLGKKIWMTQ